MSYNVTVSGTDYEGISKIELPITDSNEKATFYASKLEDLISGSITSFESDLMQNYSSVADYYFKRAYAFYDCAKLESVSLPNVDIIPTSTFESCTSLKNVNIPLVENIMPGAFKTCSALEKIDLPCAKIIGEAAFHKCTALIALILRSDTVCKLNNVNSISEGAIASGTGYIYVPSALIDSYKTASNWSTYENQFRAIEDYPDICG